MLAALRPDDGGSDRASGAAEGTARRGDGDGPARERVPEGLRERVQTGPPAIETGDAPPTPRIVAPGGWRRALIGFALGAAVGAAAALVAPRDEGPRRALDE